ncbi:MAG TPA: hypothetical protein VFA15_09615 [Nitrososphaera sp.]|nr:hypothetical protein [Nitrososphaera sp.]
MCEYMYDEAASKRRAKVRNLAPAEEQPELEPVEEQPVLARA